MTAELRIRSLPQADAVGGIFCVYDEPSTDLCLHKNLHLPSGDAPFHDVNKKDNKKSVLIHITLKSPWKPLKN